MRAVLPLFFAPLLAAQIDAKYSRVSLEGLQALSGDKVPKSAAVYSVRACNVGSVDELLSDQRLMLMSPVPVDDQRIPVLQRTRERGVRKMAVVRDMAGLALLGLSIAGGSGDGAKYAKIGTGGVTGGLTILDRWIGKSDHVPDVGGHLDEAGPRYTLQPGECRSGWYVGLFLRDFSQATVKFDNPKPATPASPLPQLRPSGASFEVGGWFQTT